MAAYQNRISILLTAQDEASAVIAATAAQVKEAQESLAAQSEESATAVSASNEEMAASSTESATATSVASHAMADAVDESAEQIDASNAMIIAGFNAVADSADEKLSTTGGLAALGIAAAVGAAAYEMVKAAGDFQKSVTQIYSSAGETAPLQTIDSGILQIARDTGTATSQLTNGLYTISSAGFNAANGLVVLRAAAEGAKAENADMGTVTNALTTILHDYGMSASQSYVATNQMIAAVSAGKMHLDDFAGSLSTVLPIAHQVGLSFAQIAGAEATLTAGGVQADQATQDLRAVIQSLQNPNSVQIAEMQQLGLSSVELAQNLGTKGLTGTLQQVSEAILSQMGPSGLVMLQTMQNATVATKDMEQMLTSMPGPLKDLAEQLINGTISFAEYRSEVQALPEGMTNLGKQFEAVYNQANSFNKQLASGSPAAQTYAQALDKVFGRQDAVNAVMMLTGSNMATFQKNVDSVSSAANTAGDNISSWGEIQKNFNQQLDVLKEDVFTTAISIGEALLPALTEIARILTLLLSPIISLISRFHDVAAAALIVAAALTSYIAISWATTAAFGALAGAVGEIADAIIALGTDFLALQVAIGPIGWAIEAALLLIAGAAYLIVTHWSDVKQWINDFWQDIQDGAAATAAFVEHIWDNPMQDLKDIGHWITDGFNDALTTLATWARSAGELIASGIGQGLSDAQQWAVDIGDGVEIAVRDVIRNAPQWGRDIVQALEQGAIALGSYDLASLFRWGDDLDQYYQDGLQIGGELLSGIGDGFMEGYRDALRWGHDLLTDVRLGWDEAVRDAVQWAKDLFNAIGSGFTAVYRGALTWGRNIIGSIVSGLETGAKSIGSFFESLPSRIGSDLSAAGRSVADVFTGATTSRVTDASRMKNLGDAILKGIGIAIVAVLGAVALLAVSLGIAIINGIIKGIQEATRLLGDAILHMWDALSSAFDHLGNDIVQWATDVVNDVVGVFKTLPDKIGDAVKSVGKSFGRDLSNDLHIAGFASGTSYAPGGIANLAENGAELVTGPTTAYLPRGSQVLTAEETASVMGAGKGVVIQNLNVYNNTDAGLVVRQIGWQLANAA